nr:MAG TPA: hypothetical protein [Caudoviricetes sp.]
MRVHKILNPDVPKYPSESDGSTRTNVHIYVAWLLMFDSYENESKAIT